MPLAELWVDQATRMDNFFLVAVLSGSFIWGVLLSLGYRDARESGDWTKHFVSMVMPGSLGAFALGGVVAFLVGGVEALFRAIF